MAIKVSLPLIPIVQVDQGFSVKLVEETEVIIIEETEVIIIEDEI